MKSRRQRVRETHDEEQDDAGRPVVSFSQMPDGELKAPPDAAQRRDSTRTSGTRRKETGYAFYVWIALACVVTSMAAGGYLLATR